MDFKNTPTKKAQGAAFTLVEVMVALVLAMLVSAMVASLIFFSSRSFAAMSNYTDMNQRTQIALDKMSKEIRHANQVTAYSPHSISFEDPEGNKFGFTYDPDTRKLLHAKNGQTKTYLTECDSLHFWVYQHTMKSNTFDCYAPAYLTDARVVQVTWRCSRKIMGMKATVESVQAAKVVLRNR